MNKEIYILPEPETAQLPFEMLLSQSPHRSVYTPSDEPDYAASFLINNYTFFYGPNTVDFFRNDASSPRPKMLIVANPFEDEESTSTDFTLRLRTGWRFDALAYAQIEATKIKRVLPSAKVLAGSEARELALKQSAKNFNIIHVASHAFTDTLFEEFSGLALAAEDNAINDGLLQGFEIKDIAFAADLVVLSACETGRGRAVSGEGVLALPRQFLLAGTSSVLMSQWKVDDRFTSIIMPLFYQNYLRSAKNKATALQQSKLQILNDQEPYHGYYYQHPFFWAAFNLFGDPGMEHAPYTSFKVWPIILSLAIAGAFGLVFFRKRSSTR